ncbi:MAG: hypothetical protein IJI38_11365, partial [Clostridia bacterium]|nr:hypothetical protein [Clostridia bacterium]
RNNATWAVIKLISGEESFGLLLRDDYARGHLWTLAVPDAFPDLYALPQEVLSRIRQSFPVQGVWLEGGARISLFVYDNDSVIVYPYVMDGVQRQVVRLHVRGASALLPAPGEREIRPLYVSGDEAVFEIPAVPGKFTLYQIIREKTAD